MTNQLDGKVILITGAGNGIGRDFALAAAKNGARVVVNDLGVSLGGARDDDTAAERVVAEIASAGGEAIANGGNVAIADDMRALVADTIARFGRLDGVINNAGILRDSFFHKMDEDTFAKVLQVHLNGSFNVARAAADVFRDQNGGSYVHMTSTSGLIGNLAQANYSAAKMGVVGLSKSIALDMQRWNVRSNCVAPFAWSRMISAIKVDSPEQEERVRKLREMTPAKIAPLALYLCSDQAADVTGQVFCVRNNEIFLMSQPRPMRSVHNGDGWDIESVANRAIPALRHSFFPLEVSADVFSWDPV